jgi:hypothetical protein
MDSLVIGHGGGEGIRTLDGAITARRLKRPLQSTNSGHTPRKVLRGAFSMVEVAGHGQGLMVGVAGFEPAIVGVKDRCLTAWPHPNKDAAHDGTRLRRWGGPLHSACRQCCLVQLSAEVRFGGPLHRSTRRCRLDCRDAPLRAEHLSVGVGHQIGVGEGTLHDAYIVTHFGHQGQARGSLRLDRPLDRVESHHLQIPLDGGLNSVRSTSAGPVHYANPGAMKPSSGFAASLPGRCPGQPP